MRTTSTEDCSEQVLGHREGQIRLRRLFSGDPLGKGNFEWSVCQLGDADHDYKTPRHHHNFAQLIHVLNGSYHISKDIEAPEGSVVYTGEGTYYGPQQSKGCLLLLLQYGEASGSGFLSYDQLAEGRKRLAEKGTLDRGIYREERPDGSVVQKDGYEAIWEEMRGRPVNYPPARYARPVLMNPASFSWEPLSNAQGVEVKHLGTFTELRTGVEFHRYSQQSNRKLQATSRELHYVSSGELDVSGTRLGVGGAVFFDEGDEATLSSDEGTQAYVLKLPKWAT